MRDWLAAVGALAFLYGFDANAQEPWQWSTVERLRARVAQDLASERVAAYVAGNPGASIPTNVIEGKRNPELILPSEAFRFLILTTFVDDRIGALKQAQIMRTSSDILKTETDWKRLHDAVAAFIADLRRREELAAKGSRLFGDQVKAIQGEMQKGRRAECFSGKRALESAYELFGRTEFDRLLYVQIAPNLNLVWSNQAPKDLEEELAREEQCAGY